MASLVVMSTILTGHIRDDLAGFRIHDHRTFRNLQDHILTVCTMAAFFTAFLAITSFRPDRSA